jgi:hypothetical protein
VLFGPILAVAWPKIGTLWETLKYCNRDLESSRKCWSLSMVLNTALFRSKRGWLRVTELSHLITSLLCLTRDPFLTSCRLCFTFMIRNIIASWYVTFAMSYCRVTWRSGIKVMFTLPARNVMPVCVHEIRLMLFRKFLSTDEPVVLSWVLSKTQDDG